MKLAMRFKPLALLLRGGLYCLSVIPAQAGTRGEHTDVLGFEERGIQFKHDVRGTQRFWFCVLRTTY